MTRIWTGVEPREMCRQHLSGEHKEIHQLVGTLNAGRKLGQTGRYVPRHPDEIRFRHFQQVVEMERRGWNHASPLPEISNYVPLYEGRDEPLTPQENRRELADRCGDCRALMDTNDE